MPSQRGIGGVWGESHQTTASCPNNGCNAFPLNNGRRLTELSLPLLHV